LLQTKFSGGTLSTTLPGLCCLYAAFSESVNDTQTLIMTRYFQRLAAMPKGTVQVHASRHTSCMLSSGVRIAARYGGEAHATGTSPQMNMYQRILQASLADA
jgi:hypothetical protein